MKRKKTLYLPILKLLKETTNLKIIQEALGISKQNLHYYLRQLNNKGYIIKRGHGHWEVLPQSKNTPKDTIKIYTDSIRGHAFIWRLKIPKDIPNWENRIKILTKHNISFKLIGILKNTPRIIINNKKVWLGDKSIIIYESGSFYAKNSLESRKHAVVTLLETIYKLESKLGISLKPYKFKPTREHYGQIKNDLARQCNRKGEKLHIRDNLEGEWLWIDDSESLGELETKNIVRSKQVQDWWNDNKKHNFEVTPTFLMESISQVTKNQLIFDRNIEKHQKVLEEMAKTLKMIQDKL